MKKIISVGMLLICLPLMSGCTAIAVVDAAASTAVGVTKVAVKGVTATTGALIPDGEDEKKEKK